MIQNKYKYIYGPVSSWRLGSSLGIDPISCEKKICTFDCVYCQIVRTRDFRDKREEFVSVEKVVEEIRSLPPLEIDYVTFSGRGEPTLAKNLGTLIKEIKKISKKRIAVITNSSLIDRDDVREDLKLADFVMAKLDVCSEELFGRINRPMQGITFDKALKGIKEFKSSYKGKLALQIMFVEENKIYAKDLFRIAKEIDPDEVQINTPLRPCAVQPLPREEMCAIKNYFEGMNVSTVYEARKKDIDFIDKEDTLRRRGKE